MTIKQWPKNERPREKLIQKGADYLSDSELLAITLGHGHQNQSAIALACTLLTKYQGIRKIANASFKELIALPGIGPAKYCQLQAAFELSKRSLKERLIRSNVITDTTNAKQYLLAKLRDSEHEILSCLFLDTQHCVIGVETLSHGNLKSTEVNPRQIIQRVLHHNASSIILAHNHPSGCSNPSQSDIMTTHTLTQALAVFDIQLLDHFIIGESQVTSLAEEGLI